MDHRQHKPLQDRTGLWLAAGGVLAAVSAIPISVGVAQRIGNSSLWSNGWFVLGVIVFVLGVACLFWAAVLVTAHWYAEGLGIPREPALVDPSDFVRIETRTFLESEWRAGVVVHNLTNTQLNLYAQVVAAPSDPALDARTPWWLWPDHANNRATVPPKGRVFLPVMRMLDWRKQPDDRWSAPDVEPWFGIIGATHTSMVTGPCSVHIRVWNEPTNALVAEFVAHLSMTESTDRLEPVMSVTSLQ